MSADAASQKERPRTPRGHFHAEAFCLMWYVCVGEEKYQRVGDSAKYEPVRTKQPCGHREQYWNSRDGVTPFGTICPSCGGSLLHTQFNRDRYAPDHKPHRGQRVWISMTRERAEHFARRRIARLREAGHDVPEETLAAAIEDLYHDGQAPDCKVWGYEEQPVQ